jgi:hypothetical protein
MRLLSPTRALGALILGGLLALGGLALAQITSLGYTSLLGSENIEVQQGIGGTSGFVTTGRMTSGQSYAYFTAFPASFTIGQTVGGVSTAGMANGGVLLINVTNSAATLTLPPSPIVDGTLIGVCNATASAWAANAVTVAANSNQSLVGSGTLTTLAASTCAKYAWNLAATTWFRVQ